VKRKNKLFKWAWILAIAFAGWILLAPFLAKILIIKKPLERADVIIVLAGSATYGERTRRAAELFKQGVAPRILLTDDGERSGWSRAEQRNTPFVELARRNLIENGVPAENIEILLPQVAGTIYEARLLQQKLTETNWQSILLVTSAYHTRRALRTFEQVLEGAGVTAEIGIESPSPGEQTPLPGFWWLSSLGWNLVAGEYVKLVYYWVYY
jgi:uncharacterized SAM-binding protein YcdF (DUF218 family)